MQDTDRYDPTVTTSHGCAWTPLTPSTASVASLGNQASLGPLTDAAETPVDPYEYVCLDMILASDTYRGRGLLSQHRPSVSDSYRWPSPMVHLRAASPPPCQPLKTSLTLAVRRDDT